MTTAFPFTPSTFPTMSLGAPANLSHKNGPLRPNEQKHNEELQKLLQNPPASANFQSILHAIQSCSSHKDSIRRPAEDMLATWENVSGMISTGYLHGLVEILDATRTASNYGGNNDPTLVVDENSRLMAAILLKNGIPKVFSVSLPDMQPGNDDDVQFSDPNIQQLYRSHVQSLYQERDMIRTRLPQLLFTEPLDKIALHLQLALGNIALFEFPKTWPSLLQDLASVASSSSDSNPAVLRFVEGFRRAMSHSVVKTIPTFAPEQTIRIRAIRTLRLCLQSLRHRKLVVQKPSSSSSRGGIQLLDLRNLGSLIGKAVSERKEVQSRACTVFDTLAEGIVRHGQTAISGDVSSVFSGDSSSISNSGMNPNAIHSTWQAESILTVGYIKCMTELLPMMNIEDVQSDPRVLRVKKLTENLSQICQAVKLYPMTPPPPLQALVQNAQQPLHISPSLPEEFAIRMDKVYRASLTCCIASIRFQPQLFAGQIPHVLPSVVEPILTYEAQALQSMPVKRLIKMTGFIQVVLMCAEYDSMRARSVGSKNAVLAALMGRRVGDGGGDCDNSTNANDTKGQETKDDPEIAQAKETVTALLSQGTCERLVESLVGKFLRLHPNEVEEWDVDPEGRYETDLAEKAVMMAETPRHCADALMITLLNRETDRVAEAILDLTQRVYQLPQNDSNIVLSREACYRAIELAHMSMVGGGKRRLNFSEWWQAELHPILQTDLGVDSPVVMRAMQARAVQMIQVYATSLGGEEYGIAFHSIAKLMAAPDIVTSLCAARCINHLALLHVKGTEESAQLNLVRQHSVLALGNAFALANRVESEECLRVTLACVSGLVEANGIHLEPVLQAIAEQLPPLWERAKDSVPIHSCLLSVLTHLIMKMGYSTVEHPHIQTVLFPLLDYCTDISIVNRAETLLEDGLRLWLVTLVSSRVATMGQSLASMLPRLELILRSGLELHLSLKVLQSNAILLGPQVIEPLAEVLREMLVDLTSCVHIDKKPEEDDEMKDDDDAAAAKKEKEVGTVRDAIAAMAFADALMQLFPELGYSIASPALSKVIAALPGKSCTTPLLEAAFGAFGRMLWLNANSLDEIFPNNEENIASVVYTWMDVISSVSVMVMLSSRARTIMFIDQKGAALALCGSICRSPRIARIVGNEILQFTGALLETEAHIDLDSLVEAACGTTRKVVGDGPLGDSASRTAGILKSDPLLTVSLKEAFERAEKSIQESRQLRNSS
eukprot:CAMPEP_0171399164 /NCGR_PEP_ID=MMETSP0880-20121228/6432_1 /TAXON_ID=67004 /ORGANISM="Thalassiosira weissflogii, Strain CCMP1336" /LENGTH=1231 /DNA_ID=CAMNT_0011913281 /DNA_START=59 /DNA_END=3754 /DNA_ORIENTATION=-